MSAQEFPSLVNEAKHGNVDAVTALIMMVARDLRAFIATFAASPAMMEDVHAATWMQVRREIAACPPTSQVIVWIRQRAMVILQHRLEQERNQAIAAKDGLRHLVAQDGLEGLQALIAPTNDGAAHINKKYSELDEAAQVLIHRRYAENTALDILAAEMQLSGQAEVAIRLFIARALLHWRATAEDGRAPDDRLFPVTIELHIASSIQPDARQQLSVSLLKDLARAAAFTRQMRIDMLLRAVFGAFNEDDARVLANSMGQIEHKRRNESSLLQVAAPTRMPVGSGSELMRVQDRIGERQSRAPNTPTARHQNSHGSSPNKRHQTSSNYGASESPRHRGKRGKPPIALIGGGLAAIGILVLVMLWGFGSDKSDTNSTSAARGQTIATILGFQGDFNLLDGTTEKPGTLGMSLQAGQGLRSGEGEVTVELSGNSRLVIGPKAEVRAFDKLSDGTGQAQLDKGAITIQSMATPGMELRTVQARISFGVARGSVTTEGDRTVIQATIGAIVVTAIDGSGTITMPPGSTVIALTGAAPKLLQPRAFVRGINFGGNLVNIDGQKWLAHRQALSGGLKLGDGTNIAAVGALSGAGLDYDRKSMLDTGLSANGRPIELTQIAPDGEYDVTLWLGNTTPSTASALTITINNKKLELAGLYLPRTGWAQIGPVTVHNSNKQLAISVDGIGTGRLSGLLLEAPKSDNLVMPPSIQLSSPVDASSFYSNEEFAMQADVVGMAKSVQFYAGEVLLGEITAPPFRMLVKAPAPGDHKLIAKAINPGMNASTSLPLGISVSESFGSGSITFEHWDNVKGRSIDDALKDASVSGKPSNTYTANKFQAKSEVADFYYARARAYIHPPITGKYVFWITCDDEAQLWLSTDHSSDKKQMIAHSNAHTDSVTTWTKYPTQESKPISLIRGQRYFIEYRLKEAATHDYGAVGWKLPNGVMERPISGAHLSPADKP